MPKQTISTRNGKGDIKKQGHTAQKYGSDPDTKGHVPRTEPRELSIKGNK